MKNFIYILTILLGFVFLSCKDTKKESNAEIQPVEEDNRVYMFDICIDSLDVQEYKIKSGDNLSAIYSALGFSGVEIDRIVKSSSDIINPKSLRPGMAYYVFTSRDTLPCVNHIVFAKSRTDFAIVNIGDSIVTTETYVKPITTKRQYAEGVVESNLWNAVTESGVSPMLALELSDIFAWQIDFFGIQKGDGFKVIYEEAFVDDTIPLAISSIEGVIFTHNKKDYVAIPFVQDDVRTFFDENGNSTRKAFLKAPLDFFRITSRFTNSRFHPVLKRYRSHHGVDYAAPVGTPVKSIGDGVVIAKGYQKNGGGNYIKVKHNATYTTTYMHLSKFAAGMAQGTRVQQGQVIGYVGSTGLSTGPHLDFRVYKNGTPIDPLKMEAPPATPVKPELVDSFFVVKQEILSEIDSFSQSAVEEPELAQAF